MKLIKIVLRYLTPIVILAAFIASAWFLLQSREKPETNIIENPGILVETMTATQGDVQAKITGYGNVIAYKDLSINLQVSGLISYVHPNFILGGLISVGEEIIQIEKEDFEILVETAEAEVDRAEYQLQVTQAQAQVARGEWERRKFTAKEKPGENSLPFQEPDSLALFEPQIKNSQALLNSTKAGLRKAKLDLNRTSLKAPFNGLVVEEHIEEGQFVRAGDQLGRLIATKAVEIIVRVPISELTWLASSKGLGSLKATVRRSTDARTWNAEVARIVAGVEPSSRMAGAIVRVDDPGFENASDPSALRINEYVAVDFYGATMEDVFELPRRLLRRNNTVWICTPENTLEIRAVDVVRRTPETVVISTGLEDGDLVITTRLSGVAEGMKLRKKESE